MPAQASQRLPGMPDDYYAPNFKVEVEGAELNPTEKGDVLEVKVSMDLENMTSFDLTINNWDDKHFGFKYSDKDVFDIGNRVNIRMGYADGLRFMANGIISTLSPKFPESGPPTLGVTGVDAMLKLKRKPVGSDVKQFVDRTDWQIAQEIAARNNIDVKVTESGPRQPLVIQKNQEDALFLVERAKRIDFDCFVRVEPDTGRDTLYFISPSDARASGMIRVFTLEWGKGLINFNPQIKLGKQVGKVTVRGWNPRTKEKITYTATADDLPGAADNKGESGPEAAGDRLPKKEDVVVDQPVSTLDEARHLAISLLRERSYDFLTGSGQMIGNPDIRPGDNLDLTGLGRRFSGTYYLTKVEHSLGSSGYLTNFEGRLLKDGGTE